MILTALVLGSTLAVLSQAYVLDKSCSAQPREIQDRIVASIAEAQHMASLGAQYITKHRRYPFDAEDPHELDNTRANMFRYPGQQDLETLKGMWRSPPSSPRVDLAWL
jgi:hypothetical protein